MTNKYEEISDYEHQMIEAYIDKPQVTHWYVNAFKSFHLNGVDIGKWHWSWWAFFGSVFFLLYRKTYLPAAILFILLMGASFIPFGWITLWVLSGGYSTFFVYKTFKEKKDELEAKIENETERLETMQALGGSNEWALVLGVIAQLFFWSTGILMIGIIFTFLSFIGLAFGIAS